ncbi:homeobox protein HMX1-like [Limulus polyphemus]|uniref:Homeobox protein HMX1-like n=1 Tax=Limulus polyphemus TaxID=6850 RepID=A0ABM1SW29_LIMPO|nr:homeobox protein HMX1-like [Limulus polyphemus]
MNNYNSENETNRTEELKVNRMKTSSTVTSDFFIENLLSGKHSLPSGQDWTMVSRRVFTHATFPKLYEKNCKSYNIGGTSCSVSDSHVWLQHPSCSNQWSVTSDNNTVDNEELESSTREEMENYQEGCQSESEETIGRCHPSEERKKRQRTTFTATQIKTLESEFERNRYLSVSKRMQLSKTLQLTETQIKIWFQNRRTKWKRMYTNDLEVLAQHYYQSLGMFTTRPMFIGDRLWLFSCLPGHLNPNRGLSGHPSLCDVDPLSTTQLSSILDHSGLTYFGPSPKRHDSTELRSAR